MGGRVHEPHPAVCGAAQVVPAERWDMETYYAPDATSNLKMDVRLAAFAPSFDCFDAAAFRWRPCLLPSAVHPQPPPQHFLANRR